MWKNRDSQDMLSELRFSRAGSRRAVTVLTILTCKALLCRSWPGLKVFGACSSVSDLQCSWSFARSRAVLESVFLEPCGLWPMNCTTIVYFPCMLFRRSFWNIAFGRSVLGPLPPHLYPASPSMRSCAQMRVHQALHDPLIGSSEF